MAAASGLLSRPVLGLTAEWSVAKAHLTTTGTYTLNADCTGTQEGVGATGAVTHYELVVAKNGDSVGLLRTDAPVLSGTLVRQ
jgi:hypothetical protein